MEKKGGGGGRWGRAGGGKMGEGGGGGRERETEREFDFFVSLIKSRNFPVFLFPLSTAPCAPRPLTLYPLPSLSPPAICEDHISISVYIHVPVHIHIHTHTHTHTHTSMCI